MPLNLAIFGVGELVQPYLAALARREDVKVSAVCDPDSRSAERVAADWGARVIPQIAPLLEEPGIDALWVGAAPRSQGDVLEQAAERGMPFFVVPPGGSDVEQAKRIARNVEAKDLVTSVGYSARYVDVVREAKEYLGVNAVPLALGWWLTGPMEGGSTADELLRNEACRLIDLLRHLCGEVTSVGAAGSGSDALTVVLRLANGTAATLVCAAYAMAEPRIELELLGEGWYFRFLDSLTTLRLAERDKTTIIRQANAPHAEHVSAFLEAVRAKTPTAVTCPYADALRTLRITVDAQTAAREGRWVSMTEPAA